MTKEEIKKTAEDMIEAQRDESGLSREEVIESSALSFVYMYVHNELAREDLEALGEYLNYPFDMEKADSLKADYEKRVAYRLKRKSKKQFERMKEKLSNNTNFEKTLGAFKSNKSTTYVDDKNKIVVVSMNSLYAKSITPKEIFNRVCGANKNVDKTYKLILMNRAYKLKDASVALENGLDPVIAQFTIEYAVHLALLHLTAKDTNASFYYIKNRRLGNSARTKELEITFDIYSDKKAISHNAFGFLDDVYLKLSNKLSEKINYLDYSGYGVNEEINKVFEELDKERGIA